MRNHILAVSLLAGLASSAHAAHPGAHGGRAVGNKQGAIVAATNRLLGAGLVGTRETHAILIRHSPTDSLLIAQNHRGDSLEYRLEGNRSFLLFRTPEQPAGVQIDRAAVGRNMDQLRHAFPRLDAKWLKAQDLRWHLAALNDDNA